jgi:hypothetical protein
MELCHPLVSEVGEKEGFGWEWFYSFSFLAKRKVVDCPGNRLRDACHLSISKVNHDFRFDRMFLRLAVDRASADREVAYQMAETKCISLPVKRHGQHLLAVELAWPANRPNIPIILRCNRLHSCGEFGKSFRRNARVFVKCACIPRQEKDSSIPMVYFDFI